MVEETILRIEPSPDVDEVAGFDVGNACLGHAHPETLSLVRWLTSSTATRNGTGRRSQPRHCRAMSSAASSPTRESPRIGSPPHSVASGDRIHLAPRRVSPRLHSRFSPHRCPDDSAMSHLSRSHAPAHCHSRGHATGLGTPTGVPSPLNTRTQSCDWLIGGRTDGQAPATAALSPRECAAHQRVVIEIGPFAAFFSCFSRRLSLMPFFTVLVLSLPFGDLSPIVTPLLPDGIMSQP